MRSLLPSTWVAVGAGLVAALAMTASPLFGVQGIESALVLGAVLPSFVAAAAARQVVRARRAHLGVSASRLLGRAIGGGLLALAVPVAVLALDALRVRNCAPGRGVLMMLLGPTPGVLLAAVVGVGFGAAVRRPALATTLAALVPIAGIADAIRRFYGTPGVSSFGLFFGWFPGAVYDAALRIPVELATFRAVTGLLIVGLALSIAALWDPGTAHLRPGRRTGVRGSVLAGGVALLACAAAATAFGPQLGYRASAAYISRQLGATVHGRRCIVHAPRETSQAELERDARDCDFRVMEAERALGVHQRRPVTVYMFRSADEKRRLMGASSTSIAKPWRDEVYVQALPWPHPLLAHEVAHVVAGNAARGPWRVAGRFGGLVPNPGLVEGVAVAVAWQPFDQLTPDQWARAMLDLHRMPPLERLLGVRFLLQQGAMAYTAAGSFVHFLLQTHGRAAVRRAYRTDDVASAVGEPLGALERAWHTHLEHVPLPADALALARTRFTGRSLFSTVCPRTVAVLHQRMDADLSAGDARRLIRTCDNLLGIDPTDAEARATLVGALARTGRGQAAHGQLDLLAGRFDAPAPLVAQAREDLADAAWQQGKIDEARRIYRSLLNGPLDDDRARGIEVKELALEAGPPQAPIVFQLLIGDDGRGASPPVAVHLAQELESLRSDGLGQYLEARQLYFRQRFDMASSLLGTAIDKGLPTDRIRREASRLLGISLFASGKLTRAESLWRERLTSGSNLAVREQARDWLARIAYSR